MNLGGITELSIGTGFGTICGGLVLAFLLPIGWFVIRGLDKRRIMLRSIFYGDEEEVKLGGELGDGMGIRTEGNPKVRLIGIGGPKGILNKHTVIIQLEDKEGVCLERVEIPEYERVEIGQLKVRVGRILMQGNNLISVYISVLK